MTIEKYLQDNYNYNPDIKDEIKSYIEQWKSWYKGNVRSFHNYFIYNGQRKVNKKRFTLNMAKEISEDWSDILWSEKCKVSMKSDKTQKQYDELMDELSLNEVINQAIEKSGALGTNATVVSVYDIIANEDGMTLDVSEAKTRIDNVDIDWIYPLTWNNKEITECAFGSVQYVNGDKYIILSVHKIADNGNYHIHNHLFKDTNGNILEIEQSKDTMDDFDTQSNIKWFSIFRPLLTNNLFDNSPFGIPHYANAIDAMKTVDIDFDGFKNEVVDGRNITWVRADMLNYDSGEQKLTFDPEDSSVHVLPKGATKEDLIQHDKTDYRTDKLINALNTSLNVLGNKVGFGENHYHFDGTNLSTATAVISSNSKMARRMKKLQIGYESSIYDLINAVCYASSKFGKFSIDITDMTIQFDDSIIEDKEAESIRAGREVDLGVISKVEYRMRIFGETEEIAKQKIQEIQEEEPTAEDLMGEKMPKDDEEDKDNKKNVAKNENK